MGNRGSLTRFSLLGALVAAMILAVACGGASNGDDTGLEGPAADGSEGGADDGRVSSEPGGGEGTADTPSIIDRKITRTANLELTVDNVLESVQAVRDIATSAGGFVSNSNLAVTSTDDGEDIETATMKIRVPATAYTDVLERLRGVAKEVRGLNEEAQEVTEEYTDMQSRLRNLQTTEKRYLDLVNRAETIPDILSLEDRLNDVRGQIEQVQGRINVLNDLTDLATISVTLLPPSAAPAGGDGKGWVEDAWDTSWDASKDVLVVVGSIAIATVVFLPWFLVPTLIGLVAWRLFGRRVTELANKVSGQGGTG